MKKLLLGLAVAMGFGFSANATLYITGDKTSPSWTPGTPVAVEAEGGYYTFELEGQFKMSTTKGTWSEFNGACKVLQGSKWTINGQSATGTLVSGDANVPSPANGQKITYKIDEALTTITATWGGEAVIPDFYLIGTAVGGWNLADANLKMTRNGNVYTKTVSSLNGEWKINDGSWGYSLGQGEAGQPKVGTLYNLSDNNAGNLITTINEEVTVTLTYVENGVSTLMLTTDGGDTPVDPDPVVDYSTWYVNVFGPFNEWKDNGVHPTAEGLSIHEGLAIGDGEFKVKLYDGKADLYYSTGTAIAQGEWVAISGDSQANMTIAGAAAGDTFDVEYNCATNEIKVTKVGGTTPDDPIVITDTYGIHGEIFGNPMWETIDLTNNNGIFEYTGELVAGEFGIMKNGTWLTGGAMTVTEANKAYTYAATGANSTSTLEGTYTIKLDPTNSTVTFVPFDGPIDEVVTYVLRGNFGEDWDDYAMTEQGDNVWTVEVQFLGSAEFGIKKNINGAQKGWYSAPTADEASITENGEYKAAGIGGTNWTMTGSEGTVTFTFNPETEILTVAGLTGVESVIASDDAAPVYYNLQGVRVAEPANGLYIVVRGSKVAKELVR